MQASIGIHFKKKLTISHLKWAGISDSLDSWMLRVESDSTGMTPKSISWLFMWTTGPSPVAYSFTCWKKIMMMKALTTNTVTWWDWPYYFLKMLYLKQWLSKESWSRGNTLVFSRIYPLTLSMTSPRKLLLDEADKGSLQERKYKTANSNTTQASKMICHLVRLSLLFLEEAKQQISI